MSYPSEAPLLSIPWPASEGWIDPFNLGRGYLIGGRQYAYLSPRSLYFPRISSNPGAWLSSDYMYARTSGKSGALDTYVLDDPPSRDQIVTVEARVSFAGGAERMLRAYMRHYYDSGTDTYGVSYTIDDSIDSPEVYVRYTVTDSNVGDGAQNYDFGFALVDGRISLMVGGGSVYSVDWGKPEVQSVRLWEMDTTNYLTQAESLAYSLDVWCDDRDDWLDPLPRESQTQWTTRQRQTSSGNAGGRPLRQRQNAGQTGGYPGRQRQNGN